MKPCLPPVRGGRVRWCHVMAFPMVRSLPESPVLDAHFPKISRKYIWELSRAVTDFIGNREAKCLCLSESPTHPDHTAHFFRRTRNLECGDTFPCWWPSLQQLSERKINLSKPIVGLVPGAGQTPLLTQLSPTPAGCGGRAVVPVGLTSCLFCVYFQGWALLVVGPSHSSNSGMSCWCFNLQTLHWFSQPPCPWDWTWERTGRHGDFQTVMAMCCVCPPCRLMGIMWWMRDERLDFSKPTLLKQTNLVSEILSRPV